MGFSNMTVADKVPEDMIHLVDSHWRQFAPMNPLWHSILGFVVTILGIVAMIGNGMVIYIFSTTKSLRSPSNMLVVNLAFSDFFMMFTMFPPMVVNCYYETWVFGPLSCTLYGLAGSLWGCASIWSMAMIAIDRYNVIVKGLSGTPMTPKRAMMMILWVWGFSGAWTVAPLFGWGRYAPEGNMSVCGTDYISKEMNHRSYVFFYALACYFSPLFTIIYCYFFIVQAVAAHEKSMREQAKKMNVASLRSAENQATSAECKLAKIALMTIALWFFAWTPYLVINFSGIFQLVAISPLATVWSSLFAKCNACYNPIVYGISHPKYRQALQNRFPSLACGSEADVSDTASRASESTVVQTADTAA